MVSSVSSLRQQTLTRLINKANFQMTLLTQQQQTMSAVSFEIGREYKELYYKLNGVYGTESAEMEDAFTSKLEQLEPVYFAMNTKDNDIDLQIGKLETQIQAYTQELEALEKQIENQAKDDAPHLSM